MTGPLDPGTRANAAILIEKRLSDDGSHLVFGSTSQFEPAAPAARTIYDRNLATGVTNDVRGCRTAPTAMPDALQRGTASPSSTSPTDGSRGS